jgi:hypothetical protein
LELLPRVGSSMGDGRTEGERERELLWVLSVLCRCL